MTIRPGTTFLSIEGMGQAEAPSDSEGNNAPSVRVAYAPPPHPILLMGATAGILALLILVFRNSK